MRPASLLLSSLAFAALARPVAALADVLPKDPVAGEPVLLSYVLCRGSSPTGIGPATVRLDGSTITLTALVQGSDFSTPSCAYTNAVVTGLAAGSYDAVFIPAAGSIVPAGNYPVASFVVSRPQGDGHPAMNGLSGNWFDPAHPGSGTNVVQGDSGALFGAWLTYDTFNSAPAWYVMPAGTWVTPTRFRGILYTTTGTPADLAWKGSDLQVAPFGVLTLDFTSASGATFEAQTSTGADITQAVRRFRF